MLLPGKARSSLLMLPLELLDSKIVEQYKACKRTGFPICLDRALTSIFGDSNFIVMLTKSDLKSAEEILRVDDVWDNGLDFLSSLERELGRDVAAVIDWKTFEILNTTMKDCEGCPFYRMELARKQKDSGDVCVST